LGGLTPFGLLRVTRVMPGTCFNPNLPIAFRAFFSLRLWTATAAPAGMFASPSPVGSGSESEELDASSAVVFLVGSSSGSSSILGFDILGPVREGDSVRTRKLASLPDNFDIGLQYKVGVEMLARSGRFADLMRFSKCRGQEQMHEITDVLTMNRRQAYAVMQGICTEAVRSVS
jgi:hypothetical protein